MPGGEKPLNHTAQDEPERGGVEKVRFEALKRESPNKKGYTFGVAAATMELAYLRLLQGQLQESEKGYRDGLVLFRQLAEKLPNEWIYRDDLASIYDNLGSLCVSLG